MRKQIQLTIADPCHENWDTMSKVEQGRFCASCQKQVVDFTTMSDSQVAAFFKKPSTGSICGRFFNDQLDRDIEIPKKRIPWVKYFFQFALPAFLFSMKATAQGKVAIVPTTTSAPKCLKRMGETGLVERKTLIGDTTLPLQKENRPLTLLNSLIELSKERVSIRGIVLDENAKPVPFATLMIKGTKIGVPADSNGVFKLENVALSKEIVVEVSSVGYEPTAITLADHNINNELVVRLNQKISDQVIVTAYSSVRMGFVTAGIVVRNSKDVNAEVKSLPELSPMIKVYPNPVISGTNINVGCQKLMEGYYSVQFLSQLGQQVFIKQVWIDGDAQVVNIDIPRVATGVYFLRLINKDSNKKFTVKVIVQ